MMRPDGFEPYYYCNSGTNNAVRCEYVKECNYIRLAAVKEPYELDAKLIVIELSAESARNLAIDLLISAEQIKKESDDRYE